ncbi:MAG: TIGR00159 family protein [Deltaproteobacteria bacterium]|nr:TIGR00159 family protein [Deltaproteobacteria bacterium]
MTTPLGNVSWLDLLDIILVAFILYRIILLIKGTIAIRLLTGLAALFLLFITSQVLGLQTLYWILDSFFGAILLVLVVVFQHDIRRALSSMGRGGFLKDRGEGFSELVDELVTSADMLAKRKIGALIVLEREVEVENYLEVGTEIDAKVSSEIITSIFLPYSPIHDGAVIIEKGKLTKAGCFLPLSRNPELSKTLGTRHRAAIGLTEVTDAVVLVVSEETGGISIAAAGKITRGVDQNTLRKMLKRLISLKQKRWFQ